MKDKITQKSIDYYLSRNQTRKKGRMLKAPHLNPRIYISRSSNIDPTDVQKYVRKSMKGGAFSICLRKTLDHGYFYDIFLL